jgi:tol-pal system protein YbgF
MARAASILAWALAFAAAFAPAANAQGLFDDNEARRRIERLREQVDANQRAMEERIAKAEAAAGSAADRSVLLDLASQIEALRGDIARMRGQIEVVSNQVETADKRQKDLYLDIDTRLRKLEQAREQQAAAPPQAPAAPAPQAPAEGEASAAETRAYQAALDQFKLGNYPLAVAAMQGFLVTYPNSTLAANAQYWVGMAYSGQRDYKSAIAAQRKLLASWPESPKASDAMLSIASSQETMGARAEAQKTLQELIAKYPGSSAAVSARQRLSAFTRR